MSETSIIGVFRTSTSTAGICRRAPCERRRHRDPIGRLPRPSEPARRGGPPLVGEEGTVGRPEVVEADGLTGAGRGGFHLDGPPVRQDAGRARERGADVAYFPRHDGRDDGCRSSAVIGHFNHFPFGLSLEGRGQSPASVGSRIHKNTRSTAR